MAAGYRQLVVQKSRRESAHAQNLQFKSPTKRARMRGFSSRFLDNQLENPCSRALLFWSSQQRGKNRGWRERSKRPRIEERLDAIVQALVKGPATGAKSARAGEEIRLGVSE